MPDIQEGRLTFTFPETWRVEKYDETSFHKKHFQNLAASKCVDIVAFNTQNDDSLWLIEVKDYRPPHQRSKRLDLYDEIALKMRDTLASLFLAQRKTEAGVHEFAVEAAKKTRIRVVLHLEQPVKPSRLYPEVVERSRVRDKLRQKLRVIDEHAIFCEMSNLHPGCAWIVTRT